MRRRAACRALAVAVALGFAAACATVPAPSRDSEAARWVPTREVTVMLARAAGNWNRGDLDAFVDDYQPGAATTFIGSRGVLRGRAEIRAAYAPRFAPGGTRDSLSFEIVDVDPVAPDALNVIAMYTLARRVGVRDSVTARGPTSLLLRRVDGRWRIVHDHSS